MAAAVASCAHYNENYEKTIMLPMMKLIREPGLRRACQIKNQAKQETTTFDRRVLPL